MTRPNRPVTRIQSPYMNKYNAHLERQQRRRRGLIQRLIVISMAFMVVFGVMITYHIKQRTQHSDLEQQYTELNEELSGLERQKDNLQEEADLLNDEEYILDIARTNYFLSKKGELIFQVEDLGERTY